MPPLPPSSTNVRLRHMLIGYARVSKADGSQSLDLQRDALLAAGVDEGRIYSDRASGKKDERPGLEACLKALRQGDVLVVWKLDRLGRSLHHLVKTVTRLSECDIGLKVLTGQGAQIDTTTAAGRLSFGIFAALAEFESELIRERTVAGLQAARARGRKGRPEAGADKGASAHDPVCHGAPGHIRLRTVRGTRDLARHPSTAMSIRKETCESTAGGSSADRAKFCTHPHTIVLNGRFRPKPSTGRQHVGHSLGLLLSSFMVARAAARRRQIARKHCACQVQNILACGPASAAIDRRNSPTADTPQSSVIQGNQ